MAFITSPTPGIVREILVRTGDRVQPDQVVVRLEVMKMIYELTAGMSGLVEGIRVAEGDMVESGQVLVQVGTM